NLLRRFREVATHARLRWRSSQHGFNLLRRFREVATPFPQPLHEGRPFVSISYGDSERLQPAGFLDAAIDYMGFNLLRRFREVATRQRLCRELRQLRVSIS